MKKIITYSFFLTFIVACVSLYSCGDLFKSKLKGNKYKCEVDNKRILSFTSDSECNISYETYQVFTGSYKVVGKTITLNGKYKDPTSGKESNAPLIFTIQDDGNTKLKDPQDNIWNKM